MQLVTSDREHPASHRGWRHTGIARCETIGARYDTMVAHARGVDNP